MAFSPARPTRAVAATFSGADLPKRRANPNTPRIQTAPEPLHALRGRAVRERFGSDEALTQTLKPVVPDSSGRAQRGFHLRRRHQIMLLRRMGPDTGEAIGLQLETNR